MQPPIADSSHKPPQQVRQGQDSLGGGEGGGGLGGGGEGGGGLGGGGSATCSKMYWKQQL